MTIRIVIADDHKIVRDGLRALLEEQPDFSVVGEAENGRQAVELADHLEPDLVIMDISMSELNGVEATRQVLKPHPSIKVIALSMHSDKRYVSRMLQAGASGYLLKQCAFEELVRAIRAVHANGVYLSPQIAGVVLQDYLQRKPTGEVTDTTLSSREEEVLQLLAEGLSTKQIAAKLHVSGKTIETHRRRLMQKLNLFSVAELTRYAVREGLVSP